MSRALSQWPIHGCRASFAVSASSLAWPGESGRGTRRGRRGVRIAFSAGLWTPWRRSTNLKKLRTAATARTVEARANSADGRRAADLVDVPPRQPGPEVGDPQPGERGQRHLALAEVPGEERQERLEVVRVGPERAGGGAAPPAEPGPPSLHDVGEVGCGVGEHRRTP